MDDFPAGLLLLRIQGCCPGLFCPLHLTSFWKGPLGFGTVQEPNLLLPVLVPIQLKTELLKDQNRQQLEIVARILLRGLTGQPWFSYLPYSSVVAQFEGYISMAKTKAIPKPVLYHGSLTLSCPWITLFQSFGVMKISIVINQDSFKARKAIQ